MPASGCSTTSTYRSSEADQPSTASAGRAARRMMSATDSTTATTIACSTPTVTTHATVMAAITTSTLLLRVRARHWAGSISLAPAYTMIAPSTAEGRYWMGPVRNNRMVAMVPAATSPLTWLVAPMSSLTAVRDPLVPTGMPWVTPAAIWATPNASSSWLASTTSWWRAAKEREMRMESEKATRKTASAGSTREP